MAKTREIKGRIKAVSNIQRITKTMQMIATARFQAAQKRATASRPYATKIAQLVAELSSALLSAGEAGEKVSHPLLQVINPAVNRRLVLVITSNRGLCGGYNAGTLRKSMAWLRENKSTQIDLEVVGKKGAAFFKFNRVTTARFHSQFTDKPDYQEADKLAQRYMDLYTAGKYDSIHVVYMSFLSMSRQTPAIIDLLPLSQPTHKSAPTAAKSTTSYEFSPSPKALLDELLPITVKTRLFQCFNEAVVGEQIARMVAMKAATDAAGKMKKTLTRKFNRARQTAITTELSEIISGAAALA